MRCLACGGEMALMQSEPHESLPEFKYCSFRCRVCADTENRLLPLRQVTTEEILASARSAQSTAMPKPQEKIGRKESRWQRDYFAKLRKDLPDTQPDRNTLNEILKYPKKFIEMFVRDHRQHKPNDTKGS